MAFFDTLAAGIAARMQQAGVPLGAQQLTILRNALDDITDVLSDIVAQRLKTALDNTRDSDADYVGRRLIALMRQDRRPRPNRHRQNLA